jgi:hypothetical protein
MALQVLPLLGPADATRTQRSRLDETFRLTVTKYFVNDRAHGQPSQTTGAQTSRVRPTTLEVTILQVLWDAGH